MIDTDPLPFVESLTLDQLQTLWAYLTATEGARAVGHASLQGEVAERLQTWGDTDLD